MSTRRSVIPIVFTAVVAAAAIIVLPQPGASKPLTRLKPIAPRLSARVSAQNSGLIIFPASPVAVAPNQPEVQDRSTVGIINALCDVTLDFIGCGFTPTSITINCDANGDGLPELVIPLKNITIVNRLLLQATIPALTSTPGTAFPLACCGGQATVTLVRTVGAGDDNAFGPFTETATCPIDLGLRAPVVISATPSEGDCAQGQNLIIPGACFVLADGKPNVTSVFAVELGNPNNVIQATAIHILNPFLIDAFFQIGAANAGKTFLIFVSGPNGTSRNLTTLPANAPPGCPLGNEQGIQVTFKCKGSPIAGDGPPPPRAEVVACNLERDETGVFTLDIRGFHFVQGATVRVNGIFPRKLKFRDPVPGTNDFLRIRAKGRLCGGLPGSIVVINPAEVSSQPFFCGLGCAG